MAANKQRANLTSDHEVLLEIMQELPDDSGSEDEFDGYLDEDDGPIVLRASGRCSIPPHSYLAVVQLRV